MIGTGIYSAPATVFLLTGNKSLTLGLFSIGFMYTLISMVMYLDFAEALPFTGGELVYLDEISAHMIDYLDDDPRQSTQQPPAQGPLINGYGPQQRVVTGTNGHTHPESPARRATRIPKWKQIMRKFLGDGLLSYISFSMSFVGLFNSGTNSMQTGRMILICIASTQSNVTPDVNLDVVRLIAVCTLTALCLLQYFSPESGRKLNQALAVVKIIFLLALIIVAIVASAEPLKTPKGTVVDRAVDWNVWHKKNPRMSFAKALLAVLFSFEGWENATFVAGEIPANRPHVLRRGFISAVFTVGFLYLLIVALFLHSTTWEDISGVSKNVNYAPMLSGNGVTARRAWAVLAAISSLGSLNSIIYTFSRVKQAIGQAEVLPWSIVWKKDDILQRERDSDHPGVFLQKAPQGGLIIHWTMSVVVIAGSSSIKSTLESVGLPGYVQTYAHCFILMIIGAAYLNLSSREDALARPAREPIRRDTPGRRARKPPFRPSKMTSNVGQWVMVGFVGLYVALNGAILIINAIPPYVGSDGTSNAFKGFGFPIIVLSILAFSITYYVLVFGAARRVYPIPGHPEAPPIVEEGLFSPNGFSLLRLANVKCEIRKDRYFNPELDRVRRFGRRWRIVFSVPGDDLPEPTQNDVPGNADGGVGRTAPTQDQLTWPIFWYWLFGGSRLRRTMPEKMGDWWRGRRTRWSRKH
ncbi:amino acid permease-domain-containing protein [Dactylonectria macrodidyma]|uniref:Amino acid permease-domain-containing protein n=1 Tax=Dactylonectria macrodidyma TaxID=307937 RepID=A0A9P9EP43_9HYPO|nr:amino acid permease-domain-containing protein [Dactylonectria macrodidyma]